MTSVEWVPDGDRWRVLRAWETEHRCRWGAGHGRRRRGCSRPAAAALNRSRDMRREIWWYYCDDHLFGRRIVGDRVCWPRDLLTGEWAYVRTDAQQVVVDVRVM